ncbi:hypothetical protein NKR23_g5461 [Pleurostoma richardsiae]|uniref:Uncharacterized protein n=1 Tax=Pleurostoma richardsiae TaxID=41990 RepID=A0AA38RP79_9PEZI|nr:hypothetical protein NKR23_g5461 [Pleurostoma richardsiae]
MGTYSHRQLRAAFTFIVRPLILAVAVTLLVRLLFSTRTPLKKPQKQQHHHHHHHHHHQLTKALVIASTSADDTAWLSSVPSDWAVHNYIVDRPSAAADSAASDTVPANKGNEAMAYLTYIITHYDALPDVVFFHHAHPSAWHQELDSAAEVSALRAQHVARAGFASARCLPGCENVMPLAPAGGGVPLERFGGRLGRDVLLTSLLEAFLDRDAGEEVPTRLAAPCCAQFAVSRGAVRARSREWWAELRGWLLETRLDSMTSGRLLEYTWHVWFGKEAEHCPDYEACRCHVFGIGDCERYFELEKTF